LFYARTPKHIHPNLSRTKKEYTASCQFKFSISSFPEWYPTASALIQQHGWYSTPGSRFGKRNLNGISRDHLFSITDGWLNNIPPNVIRHPANCNLTPHKQNQRKHTKSSITLEELYKRIDDFNKLYAVYL
jgi:ribosomal protein L31